jgi:putative long chain acyl-CoA synthase
MPRGLWRRVQERFRPARVLEFYASTEAGAILVNLNGVKEGCMGRPLPGSAQVRIARYHLDHDGLVLGQDGLAQECDPDEVGMLLARVRPEEYPSMIPMRSVFAPEDAWLLTGDLFRRDGDGDYWRLDNVADVIRTAEGPAFTTPIRDALSDLPAVDLTVAYGLPAGGGHQAAVAAITLRQGSELRARDIALAVRHLPRHQRPTIVQVVAEIPVTTWFRPLTAPLRAAGLPRPDSPEQAWYLDASGETYRVLTDAARRRLVGKAA